MFCRIYIILGENIIYKGDYKYGRVENRRNYC